MNLDIYNTHMELYPYTKDDYPIIEKDFTSVDKFSGMEVPCGYMIDDGKLYLPRGAHIAKIERLCGVDANYIMKSDPFEKMNRKHYSISDPRDELQEKSIEFLKENVHQQSLTLRTGFGKAQPLSTKIPTPYGSVKMGDIQFGDEVIGSNGKPTVVIGVFPQGVKDIYRITLLDGRYSLCTAEHLWKVTNNVTGDTEVIELARLMHRHHREYSIPVGVPQIYIPIDRIEFSHREEAQCIMVKNYDHLYMTDQEVITHNTYCVAYASTELGLRTLIITPNERLKQQWLSTYSKMFDYRPKDLMNIAGSSIMEGIMEDLYDPCDVYTVNHQTLRSYMNSHNGYMLHQFFKKLNIGIKVYDESHMEFANIITTDYYSNTDRTWYLTATFSRSDKTEAECFKRAFNSVSEFGYIQSTMDTVKHTIYHVIRYNSHISPKDRSIAIPFGGMTAVSYGKYAFFRDQNHTAYNIILQCLHILDNVEGKILIFVPLIDAVDDVVKRLKQDYPNKSVAAYHSRISKDEKESAEKKDIIVSTIKSCGTGVDIKGLRAVICQEPIASKVVSEQLFGRIRPYKVINDKGEEELKDTYFFDCVDICIAPANFWWRARFKKYESLAKEVVYLDINN